MRIIRMVTSMKTTTHISMTYSPLSRSAKGEAKREQYYEQPFADTAICPLTVDFIYHRFHILKFYCHYIYRRKNQTRVKSILTL